MAATRRVVRMTPWYIYEVTPQAWPVQHMCVACGIESRKPEKPIVCRCANLDRGRMSIGPSLVTLVRASHGFHAQAETNISIDSACGVLGLLLSRAETRDIIYSCLIFEASYR